MGLLRLAAVATATIILLIIVLIVCFVFIGLYRMTEYNAMYSTFRTPRVRIADVYPYLKTGDILLFVATTQSPSNSVLTQTYYSHAGILMREGELVYVSEAQPALELMPDPRAPATTDYRMNHGVDITPLLTRLKYYTGDFYVLRLSRPLDPAREERLKRTAERLHRDKYPYPSMLQIFLGILGFRTGARHCFQHVAHLLDCVGLAPLDIGEAGTLSAAGFVGVCRQISEISGRPLPAGYCYEPPLRILYDLGTVVPWEPAEGKNEEEQAYRHHPATADHTVHAYDTDPSAHPDGNHDPRPDTYYDGPGRDAPGPASSEQG